jgi:hypothetical protein
MPVAAPVTNADFIGTTLPRSPIFEVGELLVEITHGSV